MDITHYSLTELQDSLALLYKYRSALRQVGRRGERLFQDVQKRDAVYRVEYGPGIDESFLHTYALSILREKFGITTTIASCEFIETSYITSGMRVFAEGDMVDVSFDRFREVVVHAVTI